jgi:hypothetical protein
VNCRSLGCAPTASRGRRDDKGEGSAHLSRCYQGMDGAALSKTTSSEGTVDGERELQAPRDVKLERDCLPWYLLVGGEDKTGCCQRLAKQGGGGP